MGRPHLYLDGHRHSAFMTWAAVATPFLFAFAIGGHGFEFCMSVASWRHALRSEWPLFMISNNTGNNR